MIWWTYANWMKDDKMTLLETDGNLKIEMEKKKIRKLIEICEK